MDLFDRLGDAGAKYHAVSHGGYLTAVKLAVDGIEQLEDTNREEIYEFVEQEIGAKNLYILTGRKEGLETHEGPVNVTVEDFSQTGEPEIMIEPEDTTQKPGEKEQGGEKTMAELSADYFQGHGAAVLEEDDETYDLFDLPGGVVEEAAGIAYAAVEAEVGDSDYDLRDLVGYAEQRGLVEEVGALKARFVLEEAGAGELYDEIVNQTEERAGDINEAAWMQQQLQALVDVMSEGTEDVARAHDETEGAYEYGRDMTQESQEAIRTAIDRLGNARQHKGLDFTREELMDMDWDEIRSRAGDVEGVNGNQSHEDLADELEGRPKDQ